MATQKFLARIAGITRQITALVTSTGAGDAGKVVATGSDGRLDQTLMPLGIGANTTSAAVFEDIGVGKFVNFFSDGGVFSMRLADNSNGRRADGFVEEAFTTGETGTAFPLDGTNSDLTGLSPGARYFLGTAGGVIAAPLDETDVANANKISQEIGVAKSATELVTTDNEIVVL